MHSKGCVPAGPNAVGLKPFTASCVITVSKTQTPGNYYVVVGGEVACTPPQEIHFLVAGKTQRVPLKLP